MLTICEFQYVPYTSCTGTKRGQPCPELSQRGARRHKRPAAATSGIGDGGCGAAAAQVATPFGGKIVSMLIPDANTGVLTSMFCPYEVSIVSHHVSINDQLHHLT